jgi:hypothetical protein
VVAYDPIPRISMSFKHERKPLPHQAGVISVVNMYPTLVLYLDCLDCVDFTDSHSNNDVVLHKQSIISKMVVE